MWDLETCACVCARAWCVCPWRCFWSFCLKCVHTCKNQGAGTRANKHTEQVCVRVLSMCTGGVGLFVQPPSSLSSSLAYFLLNCSAHPVRVCAACSGHCRSTHALSHTDTTGGKRAACPNSTTKADLTSCLPRWDLSGFSLLLRQQPRAGVSYCNVKKHLAPGWHIGLILNAQAVTHLCQPVSSVSKSTST